MEKIKQIDKINYDKLMQEEISTFNGTKKTILLHSCCGPCSSACIERLKDNFDITVIYYNPNIEPLDEYIHRKNVQIDLLNKLHIKYIDADYDNDHFHELTESLRNEPEGGKRCLVCYSMRLKYTAQKAKENNFDYFSTTLTISPHKNSDIINKIGKEIGDNIGVKYLYSDFKKRNGYLRSIELSKEYNLYRQNYCGCLYNKEIKK